MIKTTKMLSINTTNINKNQENDMDLLCTIFENSSIKEEQKILTFDFSPYATTSQKTIDFHAFVLDCGYVINQALKNL
jgi:hypothetical protein